MKNYSNDSVFQTIQRIYSPDAIAPVLMQYWETCTGEQLQTVQITPGLTYYCPFAQARLVAEVTLVAAQKHQPVALTLFFQVCSSAQSASEQIQQHKKSLPDGVMPGFIIPDWNTAVWVLPYTPCLQALSNLLQPDYFCSHLVDPQDLSACCGEYPAPHLFRYVPFKRAVLTWKHPKTSQCYFIKLCNETEFSDVVAHFQKIYDASTAFSFAVPQPVKFDAKTRSLSMRALSGQQLSSIMIESNEALNQQIFYRVGVALAELHHANLDLSISWTPMKEMTTFTKAMAEVKLALPDARPALDRTLAQLTQVAETLDFRQGHPIHANLFGDQILCHRGLEGDFQLGIVDWDTLSCGDPHYDIGRLMAHYIYLAGRYNLSASMVRTSIDTLIFGYEATVNWTLDRVCLTWHASMQLLLRGKISSLRKLPDQWQNHLHFAMTEAERIIEGQSLYVTLPSLTLPLIAA